MSSARLTTAGVDLHHLETELFLKDSISDPGILLHRFVSAITCEIERKPYTEVYDRLKGVWRSTGQPEPWVIPFPGYGQRASEVLEGMRFPSAPEMSVQ